MMAHEDEGASGGAGVSGATEGEVAGNESESHRSWRPAVFSNLQSVTGVARPGERVGGRASGRAIGPVPDESSPPQFTTYSMDSNPTLNHTFALTRAYLDPHPP